MEDYKIQRKIEEKAKYVKDLVETVKHDGFDNSDWDEDYRAPRLEQLFELLDKTRESAEVFAKSLEAVKKFRKDYYPKDGGFSLAEIRSRPNLDKYRTMLFAIIQANDPAIIKQTLDELKTKLTIVDTLLVKACDIGNLRIVRFLVEDCRAKLGTCNTKRALLGAIACENIDILEYLIEKCGAEEKYIKEAMASCVEAPYGVINFLLQYIDTVPDNVVAHVVNFKESKDIVEEIVKKTSSCLTLEPLVSCMKSNNVFAFKNLLPKYTYEDIENAIISNHIVPSREIIAIIAHLDTGRKDKLFTYFTSKPEIDYSDICAFFVDNENPINLENHIDAYINACVNGNEDMLIGFYLHHREDNEKITETLNKFLDENSFLGEKADKARHIINNR
jgi:hypothetical protein